MEKREKRMFRNGLAAFIQGLKEENVIVEMRNGNYAQGVLEGCDGFLNIRLKGEIQMYINGQKSTADYFFISGSHVRYVHMTDFKDTVETVKKALTQKAENPHRFKPPRKQKNPGTNSNATQPRNQTWMPMLNIKWIE